MSSRILFAAVFCCFAFAASAQQCTRTVVYFDFNKSDLKKAEKKKLDSLIKSIDTANYFVELSGHTDSVNTPDFNQELAGDRMKSVETYLKGKKKKNLVFKQFNHGETKPVAPNDTEENMAQNRRVEIYLLSVQNDKLVFQGDQNESIEIASDMPTTCSICETLKFTFINTDQEASLANIPMKSPAGRTLTTAGMVQFSFECPEKASCLPVKFTLPLATGTRFDCLNAATLGRGNSWDKSTATFQNDRGAGTLVATEACYRMGSWTAFNKPVDDLCKHQLNFPTDMQILKSKLYTADSTFYTEQGQMPITFPCGSNTQMFSFASVGKEYYYFKSDWRSHVTKADNTGNCDTLFTYDLTKDKYQAVPISDTTVFIKFKGFEAVKSPAFYIEELELSLPLELYKKTTYTANYLNYPHTVRFEDDKPYNIKYTDVKTKYKAGKKKLKVTVKKKLLVATAG